LGRTACLAKPSLAVDSTLWDWAYNNGSFLGATAPGNADISGFDFVTGLGTIVVTSNVSGYFGLYLDHDLALNTTGFAWEAGTAVGSVAAGQSWEIDDPWNGDIYANVATGQLDNQAQASSIGDVAMALAWQYNLGAGDVATMKFTVADSLLCSTCFHLTQTDTLGSDTLYYSSTLEITPGVPEPSTYALMGIGLLGLWAMQRKRLEL